ncbi:FKBP-type peptidyl-prolyl cis-trans isomerase [Chitinophaga niabensis]|uniref:Peptidyl-prolyl cis-trans isomerase n=2 Tax=Chitinophaga niabensis TaxID=536979 RepID=A0A1N6IXZ4_9BACT|nr:FKBP-type peptidyl-prolyl cis-trans isomerase [Chitinophaga niabensis]
MLYKVLTDKGGQHIGIDDFVSFSYIEESEDGQVISRSEDFDDRPALMFRERSRFKGDLFAALGLLGEGDEGVFRIKHSIYKVKVHQVITRGKLDDRSFSNKIEELRAAENIKARDREASRVADFVAANQVREGTVAGLQYKVLKEGAGKKALPGDTIEVNYTASYLGGKVFETTDSQVAKKAEIYNPLLPYKPMAVTISGGTHLSGFEQAMLLFPKGTEALLVIPSALAYGVAGKGAILPYTPIACTISISDIKFQRNDD